MRGNWKLQLIIYTICYLGSMVLGFLGWYYFSGLVLGGAALYLYYCSYKEAESPVDLKALFSLFFIGGQGLSCLKLSSLQTDWSLITWLCFYFGYLFFALGYRWYYDRSKAWEKAAVLSDGNRYCFHDGRLFTMVLLITLVSLGCFLLEAHLLGFIPLFSSEPHAYSYFHISGVHYFTVSFVLVPPLSVTYWCLGGKKSLSRTAVLIISNLIAFSIPLLCVSRFQLLTMVMLAVLAFLSSLEKAELRTVARYACLLLVCLIPVYFYLTLRRNHDVEYLNGIFEMKHSRMPIFITQPYMYIANNYDNFNCLIEQLPSHTWGLRMLFPLWALSGLKFKFPQLVNLPIYINKEELTTLTIFYDAYYDFGIPGVLLFGGALGVLCGWIRRMVLNSRNPVSHVIYAQTALYLIFSFFTTWLSNPTTWFWYGVTIIAFWVVGKGKKYPFKKKGAVL